MKHAILYRQYREKQTLGHFVGFDGLDKIFECKILELPWLNNHKNISCITGFGQKYIVEKGLNSKGKEVYHIRNVIGRNYVQIHTGNYNRDILGCLLPGSRFVDIDQDGLLDVVDSSITINEMFSKMGDKFLLTIE